MEVATIEAVKVNFIGMTNTITAEGRGGQLQLFTQLTDFEATDEEILKIKEVQQEAAAKLEAIFNK